MSITAKDKKLYAQIIQANIDFIDMMNFNHSQVKLITKVLKNALINIYDEMDISLNKHEMKRVKQLLDNQLTFYFGDKYSVPITFKNMFIILVNILLFVLFINLALKTIYACDVPEITVNPSSWVDFLSYSTQQLSAATLGTTPICRQTQQWYGTATAVVGALGPLREMYNIAKKTIQSATISNIEYRSEKKSSPLKLGYSSEKKRSPLKLEYYSPSPEK